MRFATRADKATRFPPMQASNANRAAPRRLRAATLGAICILALGGCATSPNQHRYHDGRAYNNGYNNGYGPGYNNGYGPGSDGRYDQRRASYCQDCGVVSNIERYDGDHRTSGAGAVAGAVVGGLLGNQVGGGSGKTAATVVGAVAGGVAGNQIEKNTRDGSTYAVSVRMDDGRDLRFEGRNLANLRPGDRVSVRNGYINLL